MGVPVLTVSVPLLTTPRRKAMNQNTDVLVGTGKLRSDSFHWPQRILHFCAGKYNRVL